MGFVLPYVFSGQTPTRYTIVVAVESIETNSFFCPYSNWPQLMGWHKPRTKEDDTPKKVGNVMNFDLGQAMQLLDHVPYPIGKSHLVQFAQQHGANEQIMGMLERLPDKTFNSSQEVKDMLGGLGNLGNLGGFKF